MINLWKSLCANLCLIACYVCYLSPIQWRVWRRKTKADHFHYNSEMDSELWDSVRFHLVAVRVIGCDSSLKISVFPRGFSALTSDCFNDDADRCVHLCTQTHTPTHPRASLRHAKWTCAEEMQDVRWAETHTSCQKTKQSILLWLH